MSGERIIPLEDVRKALAALKSPPTGGNDGGMPPDITERVVRLETGLDALKATVDKQNDKIDKLDGKIVELIDVVKKGQASFDTKFAELAGSVNTRIATLESSLGQRIAAIEGQLKQIPTFWPMIIGQAATSLIMGLTIAAGIYAAVNFGIGLPKAPPTPPPASGQPPSGVKPTIGPDFKGILKRDWDKLKDSDLWAIEQNPDLLPAAVEIRYGLSREEAERRVKEWKGKYPLEWPTPR